ncbi:MAG: hemolysin III family protein [Candidatus Omnitrophica bacterium]|nr:hemolysin III family protein [Candidatus Omnitrophota bacterium]MDE2008718.1 hemolysin III family protein [Candidatus Omnitrophota bacterium]MDE2214859.1 hemolysin III family protein [Candidatus Omnitrophota bacterium]MDE2231979.1 hemolysin III family protein [Candidatus Omnitrophota bacterium]
MIGAIAVVLSVIGSIVLICHASLQDDAWHTVSFSIYGVSLIALWTVSTLYHSLNVSAEANKIWEQLDHAMIYFLIAGTYTPICLVTLRGAWGWSLLGCNWFLAVAGIVLKLVFRRPPQGVVILFFIFYLIMGWLIVLAWGPLTRALSPGALFWLVLGGIFFTLGTAFFNMRRLNFSPKFGAHEIWHLFVLGGCFSHYWMMLKFI